MSLTNYAETKILEHLTGRTTWTMPTSVFLKLHTDDPGEDATGNAALNSNRQPVTFNLVVANSGQIVSNVTVSWSNVPNTETYRNWSLWDNQTAGNPLWKGALSSNASVTAGDNFQITSLTLSLE